MRLSEWEQALEDFLASNQLPKLRGAGGVSAKDAERIAHERYTEFDTKRKEAEKQAAAETGDLEELKRIADVAKAGKGSHGWRVKHLIDIIDYSIRSQ